MNSPSLGRRSPSTLRRWSTWTWPSRPRAHYNHYNHNYDCYHDTINLVVANMQSNDAAMRRSSPPPRSCYSQSASQHNQSHPDDGLWNDGNARIGNHNRNKKRVITGIGRTGIIVTSTVRQLHESRKSSSIRETQKGRLTSLTSHHH